MSERDLVHALRERQQLLGETDAEFARRLGISRQAWQKTRTGGMRPGRRVLQGIAAAFPDLMPDLMAFLLSANASTRIIESLNAPVEAAR